MPNEIVALHRAEIPNDPRSDAELTLLYGDAAGGNIPANVPQFGAEYKQLSAQRKEALTPTIGTEIGRGAARGVASLEGSGYGAVGLAAQRVGADTVANWAMGKAREKEQESAEFPASVPTLESAQTPGDYARWTAGKLGELAPNIAEAGATAVAGAALGAGAGTAVEPVGGTAVGGLGGFIYGMVEGSAIKSLIKTAVAKAAEDGIQMTAEQALAQIPKQAITDTAKALFKFRGGQIAETVNFWAQSSGSTYNNLVQNKNVSPEAAMDVSLLGGFAQAVPSQFLPSFIMGKFFGTATAETGDYFLRLIKTASKVVPGGAAAMDLQELASIASEKYADPATRADAFDFSKWGQTDANRLLNASATGGLAGLLGAPVAAIPKAKIEPTKIPPEVRSYTGDMSTPDKQQELKDMMGTAARDINGQLTLTDQTNLRAFTPEQHNAYLAVKNDVAQTLQKEVPVEPAPAATAAATAPDSELATVTARLKENPDPLMQHPEFTGEQVLAALAPQAAPAAEVPKAVAGGAGEEIGTTTPSPVPAEPAENAAAPPAPAPPVANVPHGTMDLRARATAVMTGEAPPNASVPVPTIEPKAPVEPVAPPAPPAPAAEPAAPINVADPVVQAAIANHPTLTEDQKAATLATGRVGAITSSDINFEQSPAVATESAHNKARDVEPSYFEIKPGELKDEKELGLRLTSRAKVLASEDKKAPYQLSKRLTAVQDNETGKVFLLSTFQDRKTSDVKLADPQKVGNKFPNISLTDLLKQKAADGSDKYTPFASMWSAPRKAHVEEYGSRAEFEKVVGDGARERMAGLRAEAGAGEERYAAMMRASGRDITKEGQKRGAADTSLEVPPEEADASEHPETGEPLEETGSQPLAAQGGPTGFTEDHAQALFNVFGGEDEKVTPEKFSDLMEGIGQSNRRAIGALVEAAKHEMEAHPEMEAEAALESVKQKLYEAVKLGEAEEGGKQSFTNALLDSFGPERGGEAERASGTLPEGAQQRAAEQRAEGAGGKPVADHPAKLRQPEGVQDVSARHASLLDAIHAALVKGGMDVQVIALGMRDMTGKLATETGGSFDEAARVVAQVVGEVIGNQDVLTGLHETGHVYLARLLKENPQMAARVLRAIDKLSDRELGVDVSVDPRIRESNPAGLGNIGEERLVEATAVKLGDEGFDPRQAQGIAQQFVRALKDLYLRAAMAIQRALLGEQFTNPELARRYFENRVRQFLAGDINSKNAFVDMLGGGKPSTPKVATWLAPVGSRIFERMGRNGTLEYPHVPDIDLANARFNQLKFRQPGMDQRDRTVEVEKQAALANHTIEIIEKAIEHPGLKEAAAAMKVAPEKALLDLLNITNPVDIKTKLNSALEADKTPVKFDPDKKLSDFKSKAEAADANVRAYQNDQALISRVAGRKVKARADIERITASRERDIARNNEAHAEYANWQSTTSWATKELRSEARDLFKSIAGTSKKQGIFEQQLRQLDPTTSLRRYLPEFQKLFTGQQLKGESLYHILDKLANDPNIDFKDNVADIRDAMREDTEGDYGKFIGNDRESIALLSAVVGFAKVHQREMAALELRKMPDAAERVAIAGRLGDLKQQKADLLKNMGELGKNASTEERLRLAYRDANRVVVSKGRRIERLKRTITAADALSEVLVREHAKLAATQDIAAGAVFRDQMPYPVPENPRVTTEELYGKLAGQGEGPSQWTHKKIAIDTSNPDTVRDSNAVQADLRKMSAFLDERETRAKAGDENALDGAYLGVKRNFEEIAAHVNFETRVAPSSKFMVELGVTPAGKQVGEAFGTPAARSYEQRVSRYAALRFEMNAKNERIWETNKHLEDSLLQLLPAKTFEARDVLHKDFINPAKAMFETQDDLEERHADNPEAAVTAIMNRVMTMLLNNDATKQHVAGHEAEWRAGIQKLLQHHHDAGQWQLGFLERNRMGVTDERTKTIDVATGKEVSAVRAHVPKGVWTFQRAIDREFFSKVVDALRGSGWKLAPDEFKGISDLYNSGADGPQKVSAMLSKYFDSPDHSQQVRENFFHLLADMETRTPFEAPRMADGVTRPPADIGLIHDAWEQSTGDPVKFFERMYDLHGGQDVMGEDNQPVQNKGIFVQEGLQKLAAIAGRADKMMETITPDTQEKGLRGMFSNALIDARTIEDLPSQWFSYHGFDQRDVFKTGERVAAEIAFGRSGEALQADAQTVANEIATARGKMARARDRAVADNPYASKRQIDKAVAKEVGADTVKIASRGRLLQRSIGDLSNYFRKDNSPDGTLNAITRWANFLGALMVNQPSSALAQLAPLIDLNLRWGVGRTALVASLGTIKEGGKEIAGSLAQAVGLQIFNGGENNRMFHELNLGDPSVILKATDNLARMHGEGNAAYAARAAGGLLSFGVNPLGEQAQHTVVRPLQPFHSAFTAVNKAITFGTWDIAKKYLMNGMEFYQDPANLEKLNDPAFRLTPDNMGLRRFEKDSFGRFHNDLSRWGMNYDQMVREAMQRRDKTILTNEQATRLYGMAMAEISLESSLASRPAAGFNNPWLRAALPLLGWSFARARQVAELRLNTEGRNEMKALIGGMAGLAVISGGGLALSALIDQYYERLLGKERNLRPLTGSSDPQQVALSVLENLNRIGTFGMFGDLANTVFGEGGGGDNRVISVDQRVVAISSAQSIMQAASSFMNQGFNADYAHVIRPFFGAIGGGAYIQYLQLANNALGLDNAEARITARINAQNYLRTVGRELQMDVRTNQGGYGVPTPITPYLTNMELAAYKNNSGDFQAAYAGAVAEAKRAGNPDPVDYVKRAFAGRNPLRSVFTTPPSEAEYSRLLANMPGSGREDVSQAVRLFNAYAVRIGAKPFDGRPEKQAPVQSFAPARGLGIPSFGDLRQRATLAMQ